MNLKKIVKNNFIVVLAALVTYIAIILYSDIEKLFQIASHIDIPRILFALFLLGLCLLLLALRFHRLVSALGVQINVKKSIAIFFLGLAFSVTPFSSGTVIKSHILKRDLSVPIAKTFPIILVEKWNELVAVIILLIFFLLLHYTLEYVLITTVGIILVLVFLFVIRNDKTFVIFKKIGSKIRFLKQIEENINNSKQSIQTLTSKRNTVEGIVFTLAAKILETISVVLVFEAIGISLDLATSGQVYFSGVLLGFLSLIPGGLAITEGSILGLLLKLENDFALASAAVILIRLVTFWFPTALGLIAMKYFVKEKSL